MSGQLRRELGLHRHHLRRSRRQDAGLEAAHARGAAVASRSNRGRRQQSASDSQRWPIAADDVSLRLEFGFTGARALRRPETLTFGAPILEYDHGVSMGDRYRSAAHARAFRAVGLPTLVVEDFHGAASLRESGLRVYQESPSVNA